MKQKLGPEKRQVEERVKTGMSSDRNIGTGVRLWLQRMRAQSKVGTFSED